MTEITRQHLEDAARAAGYEVACTEAAFHGTDDPVKLYGGGLMLRGVQEPWRPHLDDGDAARLAVRVGIITQPQISVPVVNAWMTGWKHQGVRGHVRHDGTEPDKLRAWREAVVMCAAAVGERMRDER